MTPASELPLATLFDRLAAAKEARKIADSTVRHVRLWLTDPAFARYRAAVVEHVEQGKFRELDDAFWAVIPFGTGGRRGKMYPIGCNMINERTVGESAQGLADYLRQQLGDATPRSCVIAHDTRNRSQEFARLSASVLAGNGVRVFIFPQARATPQLSFAVRSLHASAGIVISASHNPPSDNGFKCCWSTGGQVLPPHDAGIIRCVEAVREVQAVEFEQGVRDGRITWMGLDNDDAYIRAVAGQSLSKQRSLRIVYSPLHGVGATSVARVLQHVGFEDIQLVESQDSPDGNFPNVAGHLPNPEQPAALREAVELARQVAADLVLASDPDADRIGAAVPDARTGEWTTLSGNQIGALLADYVVSKRAAATPGGHRDGPYVLKTLVTTELISRISEAHGVTIHGDLPVGFKWIAEAVDRFGPEQFVFAAEESHGYLAGTYARDKDAAVAALLLAELAAEVKAAGRGLLQHLDGLYCRHGYHVERTVSRTQPGREGAELTARIMEVFRTRPPEHMAGLPVLRASDYVDGEVRRPSDGKAVGRVAGPSQQQVMLEFDQPGWRLVARPSGTEPKIKFYLFGVVPPDRLKSTADLAAAKREAAAKLDLLANDLEAYVSRAVS